VRQSAAEEMTKGLQTVFYESNAPVARDSCFGHVLPFENRHQFIHPLRNAAPEGKTIRNGQRSVDPMIAKANPGYAARIQRKYQ
jgi:hypothetical protein